MDACMDREKRCVRPGALWASVSPSRPQQRLTRSAILQLTRKHFCPGPEKGPPLHSPTRFNSDIGHITFITIRASTA